MTDTHFMYSLLGTYERFEQTALTQAQLLEDQTNIDFEEIRRLERAKLPRFKEFSQAKNSSKNWGYFSAVAGNITSLIPLVSGYALSKSKETSTAGYLLMASGVTSIANRIFQSNGIYDKISSWITPSSPIQETIASRLEAGMQFASYVTGIAGGYLAASTTPVANTLTSWFTTGMNLATGGINYAQSKTEEKAALIRSEVQIAESQIQQRFQNIHQITKESERLTHTIGALCELVKSTIYSLFSRV